MLGGHKIVHFKEIVCYANFTSVKKTQQLLRTAILTKSLM